MGRFVGALGSLCLALGLSTAHAATLFGVVTERAAPTTLQAAHQIVREHPEDRIILRTPAQVLAASDRELGQWLRGADSVLAVSVFGDPARRLKQAIEQSAKPGARLLAMNGEASLSLMTRDVDGSLQGFPAETLRQLAQETPPANALADAAARPTAQRWLTLRNYWQAWGANNTRVVLNDLLGRVQRPTIQPEPALRIRVSERMGEQEWFDGPGGNLQAALKQPGGLGLSAGSAVVVLDLANMDGQAPASVCEAIRAQQGPACLQVMARWGGHSRQAIEHLNEWLAPARLGAIVVLQDFVVGAAENREAVTEALTRLNVPVFKAIRLNERSVTQWRLSPDGLPADSVQYRVALPELQGIGQPMVVSALGPRQRDVLTGLETRPAAMLTAEIERLAGRVKRWLTLQTKANADKRIAIVYYNHPPGRQNIGADNLDVPNSLFDMLHALRNAGYQTGELPASPEALLDRIMAIGVNLPEDKGALRDLGRQVNGVSTADYQRWFKTLSSRVQGEVSEGPLGRLHAEVLEAEAAHEPAIGKKRVDAILRELLHLAEGADHPNREAAIRDLQRLEKGYQACLADHPRQPCRALAGLSQKVRRYGIEGMRGWGVAPGKVMVDQGRLLVPGMVFGNVFIGPQPPRGWEVDEELLHANTSVTPPHQFLAFYHWLRDQFRADAVVHVGRHSTYEFLPGKAVGLTADDYPSLIAADLPGIYPYIVDGVGEGTQAKRRGLAVMVDHLTPPLAATPLYDQLLHLRQVVESFEAANSESLKAQAAQTMRQQVKALNLQAELEASMSDVLAVRGIGFDAADDDLLAHEIGHYLTKLQEKFMPFGLHVFGRTWTPEALDLMLGSMRQGGIDDPVVATRLADSPRQEMVGLLRGLAGGFVPPGKGNDPLRSPEALPTGRNFHAVDGDILPTRLGYGLAEQMLRKAEQRQPANAAVHGSEGIILWASDAVRDEGVMVGFALAMMGIEPVWNARGIVTDVRLKPLADVPQGRRDVVITTSGLFRDLYPNLINLIDRGGRYALAASAKRLLAEQPAVADALQAALAAVPAAAWGEEPLAQNRVGREWLARLGALEAQGFHGAAAGRAAAQRIFGDAPGAYGAGVNRLTERSGAWRERDEIGRAYRNRMGHAYGLDDTGEAAHAAFDAALDRIGRTYHGRASNLYGLLDNNDAFDYLGGLSLAIEGRTGRPPEALILQHAEPGRADVEPLTSALLGELRGRFLNPAWLKPLMQHGYAGARTMGQEFLENLWGWQVTRPDLVKNWAWDEVKSVYFDDAHQLGLPAFLSRGPNAHVKAHMLALFMVAAEKGFWKTDEATIRRMGGELAQLVSKNGLPGSGHTAPDHPMWRWLAQRLDVADADALSATLAKARGDTWVAPPRGRLASAQRVSQAAARANGPDHAGAEAPARAYELKPVAPEPSLLAEVLGWSGLSLALLGLFVLGVVRGRRAPTAAPRPWV